MTEKRKNRIVNIVVILINILLLGVICSNHCRVPDQVMMDNQKGVYTASVQPTPEITN